MEAGAVQTHHNDGAGDARWKVSGVTRRLQFLRMGSVVRGAK
jgi:hypothetical protein